jgi:hypothetical protein
MIRQFQSSERFIDSLSVNRLFPKEGRFHCCDFRSTVGSRAKGVFPQLFLRILIARSPIKDVMPFAGHRQSGWTSSPHNFFLDNPVLWMYIIVAANKNGEHNLSFVPALRDVKRKKEKLS